MGFKARMVISLGTLTCLCTVNLRVISGATPAFPTNRGVHGISVCRVGLPSRYPSCKQWRAGNSGFLTWAAARFELGISSHPLDKRVCYPLSHAGRQFVRVSNQLRNHADERLHTLTKFKFNNFVIVGR